MDKTVASAEALADITSPVAADPQRLRAGRIEPLTPDEWREAILSTATVG